MKGKGLISVCKLLYGPLYDNTAVVIRTIVRRILYNPPLTLLPAHLVTVMVYINAVSLLVPLKWFMIVINILVSMNYNAL